VETTLWELWKDGRQAKCVVRLRTDAFEVAVVYEGLRMVTRGCSQQCDVRHVAAEERRAWESYGWAAAS